MLFLLVITTPILLGLFATQMEHLEGAVLPQG